MIVGARTSFAVGRDWPALGWLGRWDAERGTPTVALALQSRLAGNNRTAYPDCDARLAPQRSGPRQPRRRVVIPAQAGVASAAAGAAVQGHSCFDVRGEVHPISREAASADVSIRFKGLVSNARGDRQPVQETQLFRLNDGLYEQVDGGPNPVPEF